MSKWEEVPRVYSDEPREIITGDDTVYAVTFSPDGKQIVSSDDTTLSLWDLTTGGRLRRLEHGGSRAYSLVFSPDGKQVAFGDSKSTSLKVWEFEGDTRYFKGHMGRVMAVAFSPSGKYIVSGSDDRVGRIWNRVSGVTLRILHGHNSPIISIEFSPDGKIVVSGTRVRTMMTWDSATGESLRVFNPGLGGILCSHFLPDGKWFMALSERPEGGESGVLGVLETWRSDTGEMLGDLKGHTKVIITAAFSTDGRQVLSASYDKTIRLWSLTTKTSSIMIGSEGVSHYGVTFSRNGKQIAAAGSDGKIRI